MYILTLRPPPCRLQPPEPAAEDPDESPRHQLWLRDVRDAADMMQVQRHSSVLYTGYWGCL